MTHSTNHSFLFVTFFEISRIKGCMKIFSDLPLAFQLKRWGNGGTQSHFSSCPVPKIFMGQGGAPSPRIFFVHDSRHEFPSFKDLIIASWGGGQSKFRIFLSKMCITPSRIHMYIHTTFFNNEIFRIFRFFLKNKGIDKALLELKQPLIQPSQ